MLRKQFFHNVLPAMLAFAFSGVYAIVDGWFVGRNIGDLGLAAINIAYPITALVQAVGTGIGMGGAILVGVSIGRGEKRGEQEYLGNTLTLLFAACLLVTGLLAFSYPSILRLFGASGQILPLAVSYSRIIALGAGLQILATGLVPLIRNYDGSLVAMASMIAGFLTNVLLDWLFVSVFPYGMAGAAAATIIGQGVTILPCVWFLLRKNKLFHYARLRPVWRKLWELFAVAISPFGLTLSPSIVIIILNKGALFYGGEAAAACYAVVSYVVCIIQLLLQGIGDGSQPLISRFYGLQDASSVRAVRKLAYLFGFSVAAVCMAAMFLLRHAIPGFFGVSDAVGGAVAETLPIFLAGFLFAGFLRITTSYFYAVKQNARAYLLIYGEPILLALLVLFVLPPLIGLPGVWIAVPLTQMILSTTGLLLLRRKRGPSQPETLNHRPAKS